WEYPGDRAERARIPAHLGRVEPGDLIFLFATGVGVIGVGGRLSRGWGPLQPGDGRRIRGEAWRAPVGLTAGNWCGNRVDVKAVRTKLLQRTCASRKRD